MKKSDFHFDLPPELIAQAPLAERSASRLLVVPPGQAAYEDRQVRDLPDYLQAGDLLVFNDTRVIPARLFGVKDSGGRVEILLERLLGGHEVLAQVGASKSPKPGGRITLDEGTVLEVIGREGEFYRLRFLTDEPLEKLLLRAGRMPLPPYIQREAGREDLERYQTLFARHTGAVAAPTAGLHFDQPLLAALQARGVNFGHVTLHVGAGTFQPVKTENLAEHQMHSEWYEVPLATLAALERCRQRGGRVVAVGTTTVRTLESWAKTGQASGDTNIFITPGFAFQVVDVLITNFHLPKSTLMMLVSAFAGYAHIMGLYRHAIAQQYRFFSYGDAMLLERARSTP